MATIALGPLEVKGTMSGNAPQVLSLPETASSTFRTGAILVLTSGFVAEAGADPTPILGVAAEPGHNGATNGLFNTLVYIANNDTIFYGNMSGKASAVTDVGLAYSVVKTGNNWHVDGADAAARRVVVVQLDPRDAVGDTNHHVHFMVLADRQTLGFTS
jgi:hypothetical protein